MARATNRARKLGEIAHTEIASTDPATTMKFLELAFNWKFRTVKTPSENRFAFKTVEEPKGACVRQGRRSRRPQSTTSL